MRYPNAYTGVSQIYRAELIAIIAFCCIGIGAILTIFGVGVADVGNQAAGAGFAITGGVFALAYVVLRIVSYVMNIVGVFNAAHDEGGFNDAKIAIIAGIVAAIVPAIFAENAALNLICLLVSRVCDILVFWFCIGGIGNLADKLNDQVISDKADSFIKRIVGIYIVGIVLSIIGTFVTAGGFLDGLIVVASAACSIIAFLSYLSLLSGAKNMLAR